MEEAGGNKRKRLFASQNRISKRLKAKRASKCRFQKKKVSPEICETGKGFQQSIQPSCSHDTDRLPESSISESHCVQADTLAEMPVEDDANSNESSPCPSIDQKNIDDYIDVDSTSTLNTLDDEDINVFSVKHSESSTVSVNSEHIAEDIAPTSAIDVSCLGRRLVDIGYFFQQILKPGTHTLSSCTLLDMEVIHEHRKGLHSTFILKCKMCNVTQSITTENPASSMTDVNSAFTLGSISIGIGYSQGDELLSAMNVPFMAPNTYSTKFNQVGDIIHESAWKMMKEAAAEERVLAIELGEVDLDGIPYITVIADGAWSKRSYNINYNAASGVACIIGQRTSKLLFLGVKNKYCGICAHADSNKQSPPKHSCFKNWSQTSTCMESEIILEGFMNSIPMHNLKYLKLVGDGDSSVHKKLLVSRPYGDKLVEKIECRNHLLRNFSKKLAEISNKKRSNSKNCPVPPMLRRKLAANLKRLRYSVTKAMEYRIGEAVADNIKILNLQKDILNVPSHVFGEHKECKNLKYFKCVPKENEMNFISEMSNCGLYQDVMTCIHRLVHNASSLICNMDNNDAEHYNAIVAKFVGGKRVNYSTGRQYDTRCEAAAISVNAAGAFHAVLHKAVGQRSPQKYTKQYVERMIRRRQQDAEKRRRRKLVHRPAKHVHPADEDYGNIPSVQKPDLPTEEYEEKKLAFLDKISLNVEQIQALEMETVGQSVNQLWQQERRHRLTASHFGEIVKMRKNTSCMKKVESILYKTFIGNEHTRYGLENERFAIEKFENEFNLRVEPCGLFVDKRYGFLAASPDGKLVEQRALVEIKCPSTAKKMSPEDAINTKTIKFAMLDNEGNMILKRNHNYYYQIQGQLNIAEMDMAYFIVWTPLGMLVEKIAKDTIFWDKKMVPELTFFFINCLLPEILDPRKARKLPIRDVYPK